MKKNILNLRSHPETVAEGSFNRFFAFAQNDETGRSMVEILGVLAVMGILSVAGISGFKSAMNRHRANELLNEASKRATVVAMQFASGKQTGSTSEFSGHSTFSGGTFDDSLSLPLEAGQFKLTLNNVLPEVCEQMKKMIVENSAIRQVDCSISEKGTGSIYFNKDLSTEAVHVCALNESLTECACPAHRDTTDGKCGDCVPSETYRTWVQPVLTSNGIMGGSDFACSASTERGTGNNWKAWRVFDGSNSDSAKDCWHSLDNDIPGFLSWYTSKPIKIKDITLINRPGRTVDAPASVENFEIQYSDDNSKWFTVLSGKNPIGLLLSSNFVVNASTAHNYWRIYITSTYNTDYYTYAIGEININADELVSVTNYELDTSTGQCVEVSE